jgi:E3 ubiquitin-protein ligase RNF220
VDIEEDVDIDGADEAVYGEAQFTERDIISANSNSDEEIEVDIVDENDLRDLVAGSSENKAFQKAAINDELERAGKAQAMPAALNKRSLNFVSSLISFFSPLLKILSCLLGIVCISFMPNLFGCLLRTHCVNRLLAYLLSRLLVEMSRKYETLPNL